MSVQGVFVNAQEVLDLEPGEVVFVQGDPGRHMYGVVSGEIELRDAGRVLTRIGADGTFGEMAIIDHAPRSLDAVAVSSSRIAVIGESEFLFLVHETPTFALQVMRALAARIRELDAGPVRTPPGR